MGVSHMLVNIEQVDAELVAKLEQKNKRVEKGNIADDKRRGVRQR